MKIDIILIGNQGSGKTCLTNRFLYEDQEDKLNNLFTHNYFATVGVNLQRKVVEVLDSDGNKQKVDLHIWDTAGQEKFFSLTKSFFQRANGVLVVYDITDAPSFLRIEDFWLKQIHDSCKDETQKILIGNKCDLTEQRKIPKEDGEKLANHFSIPFFETSAKYGEQVEQAFRQLAQQCFNQMSKHVEIEEGQQFEILSASKRQMDCWERFKESLSGLFSKKTNKKEVNGRESKVTQLSDH